MAAAWYGIALAALFFYPLASALDGSIYYVQWQPQDTVEYAVALVMTAIVLAALWHLLDRVRSPRLQLAGRIALCVVPLASFAAGAMRQLPVRDSVIVLMQPRSVQMLVFAACVLVLAALLAFLPARAGAALRLVVLILSPVTFVILLGLARVAGYHSPPVVIAPGHRAMTDSSTQGDTAGVFVFLFDELSYQFVYSNGEVGSELPNLRRFASQATTYRAASAPGNETMTSLPGLLAGKRFSDVDIGGDDIFEVQSDGRRIPLRLDGPDALFPTARAQGFETEMVGVYLNYCRSLAGVVDRCRAFSLYNFSSVSDGFSPIHPILTNLILWPYQPPFGLLKDPAFAAQQHHLVDRTMAEALRDLQPARRRFRFVHFSVPHLPFVYDASGYHVVDPMRNSAANYEGQLRYVDQMIGHIVAALREAGVFDGSTVVIMSDHEYRALTDPRFVSHIPLIVKHSGQREPALVSEPARAEEVLHAIVQSRAAATSPLQ